MRFKQTASIEWSPIDGATGKLSILRIPLRH